MAAYFSQYNTALPEEWRARACGVVALKMALDELHTGTLADLLEEARAIGAWQEAGGYWVHQKLAVLAHNYGLPAYSEEFRSEKRQSDGTRVTLPHHEALGHYGLEKLKVHATTRNAALVSVPKHFAPSGSHHMVLVTGYEDGQFVYNDSAYATAAEGEDRRIKSEDFFLQWRRFAIFTERL